MFKQQKELQVFSVAALIASPWNVSRHHISWIMALIVTAGTIETNESSNAEGNSCSSAYSICVAYVKTMLTWYAAGRLHLVQEVIVSLDRVTIRYSLVLTISSRFLDRTSLTCWSNFSSLLSNYIYM